MIAVVLGATPLPMRDSAAAMGRTIRGLTRARTATCQDSPDRICPTTTLPKRSQQRQQLPLGLATCGGSLQQRPCSRADGEPEANAATKSLPPGMLFPACGEIAPSTFRLTRFGASPIEDQQGRYVSQSKLKEPILVRRMCHCIDRWSECLSE
jgi:hypothetical protein